MSSAASIDDVSSGLRTKPMVMGFPSDPNGGSVGVDVGRGVTVCVAVDLTSMVGEAVCVGSGVVGVQAELNRRTLITPNTKRRINFKRDLYDLFIFKSVLSRKNAHTCFFEALPLAQFLFLSNSRVQGRD